MTEKFILLFLLAIVPSTFTLYIRQETITTATTTITTSLREFSSQKFSSYPKFSSSTTLPTPSITKSLKNFSNQEFLKCLEKFVGEQSFRSLPNFSDITLHIPSTTTSIQKFFNTTTLHVSPTTTSLQELPSTQDSKVVTTIHTSSVWHHNNFDDTLLDYKRFFVDKSMFIAELMELNTKFQLITRPSCFGKTFNMDMLEVFFNIAHDENGVIDEAQQKLCRLYFEGGVIMEKYNLDTGLPIKHDLKPLAVSKNSLAMQHLRSHPVIYLKLGNIGDTYSDFREQLINKVASIITNNKYHKFLLPYCDIGITPDEVLPNDCKNLLQTPYETLCNTPNMLELSLVTLAALLKKHFNSVVVILVDEYDYALSRLVNNKVEFDLVTECLKSLFTETFKYGSIYLLRGIVTGIVQFSSGDISSGIATARRCSIFEEEYATCFGFTKEEVQTLLKKNPNCSLSMSDIRDWYDGYLFSGHRMYNPQSIRSVIDKGILRDYSADNVLHGLIQRSDEDLFSQVLSSDKYQPLYQQLYTNQKVVAILHSQVDFKTALMDENEFLSTTTTLGFTTSTKISSKYHSVMIPNREVRNIFELSIERWGSKHVDTLKLQDVCIHSVIKKMSEEFGKGNIAVVKSIFSNLLLSITQNITNDLLCDIIFGVFLGQDMNWYPNRTFYSFPASGPLKQNCIIMLNPKKPDDEVQVPIGFFITESKPSAKSDFPHTSHEKSTHKTPDMVKTLNMSLTTELQVYIETIMEDPLHFELNLEKKELEMQHKKIRAKLGIDFVLDNLQIVWNVEKKGFKIAKNVIGKGFQIVRNVRNKTFSGIVVIDQKVAVVESFIISLTDIL